MWKVDALQFNDAAELVSPPAEAVTSLEPVGTSCPPGDWRGPLGLGTPRPTVASKGHTPDRGHNGRGTTTREGTAKMDAGATHPESRQAGQPAYVGDVFAAGVVSLLCAAVLYVSGLSRAIGVLVAVVGVATLLGAFSARRRRAWPSRPWLITVAVLLVGLVAYGVALLIYSALHPPVLV